MSPTGKVLSASLKDQQSIVHLAAETGTGQSMYEVSRYERTNISGTALLYDLLAKSPTCSVERVVVASSRAIYGEGAYECVEDGIVYPGQRSAEEKNAGFFDPLCPLCSRPVLPIPTAESAPLQPSSFYGLCKQVQEQTALIFGRTLDIPTFSLRYQNVYGPGQSLENPYTGILAIFSNLARAGRRLQIFEDGLESRDFVYIDDVIRATAECIRSSLAGCHAINIGAGKRTTILDVAREVNAFYGGRSKMETTGAFREGDIRHGVADLTKAKSLLGYEPRWEFSKGVRHFLKWANLSEPTLGAYERSLLEMQELGLLHERSRQAL